MTRGALDMLREGGGQAPGEAREGEEVDYCSHVVEQHSGAGARRAWWKGRLQFVCVCVCV